jgi:hypothetical protein
MLSIKRTGPFSKPPVWESLHWARGFVKSTSILAHVLLVTWPLYSKRVPVAVIVHSDKRHRDRESTRDHRALQGQQLL